MNWQPCRHCLSPQKRFFLWLLRQFWGPLAIKEDIFGLFGSLDTLNPARSNHLTPIWSLIQTYLFYELILSLVGFQCINYVLSNLLCLHPLGLGSSHFSLWNHQVSTLIDCLVQCHLFFSYSRLTKIVTSFTGCLNANLYTSFCSGS